MKLSTPKPTSWMLPAIRPRDHRNQAFESVPRNGEILQAFSALGNRRPIQGKLNHAPSISERGQKKPEGPFIS